MRLVIDTDVIVAAMRSPGGASAALLVLLLKEKAVMLLSVAMALEYEASCMRAEHLLAARATENDVQNLLDSIIDVIEPVAVNYQWRPQLSDAGDEMVLEAAVNGHADAIVTFNRRDYGNAPAQFGIEILSPQEALRSLRA
ncbi:MAG: putative toxin-antitoxin system toxin component, PIN family [Alphaproteobacteria bacterium]|nr:putative toxin-antitoxin system toxin component, PIN family [Alphaproteobacteria bacterium]